MLPISQPRDQTAGHVDMLMVSNRPQRGHTRIQTTRISLYALEFRRMPNLRRHLSRKTSVIRKNANGIERADAG